MGPARLGPTTRVGRAFRLVNKCPRAGWLGLRNRRAIAVPRYDVATACRSWNFGKFSTQRLFTSARYNAAARKVPSDWDRLALSDVTRIHSLNRGARAATCIGVARKNRSSLSKRDGKGTTK